MDLKLINAHGTSKTVALADILPLVQVVAQYSRAVLDQYGEISHSKPSAAMSAGSHADDFDSDPDDDDTSPPPALIRDHEYSPKEAAQILGIPVATVRKWIQEQKIASERRGNRRLITGATIAEKKADTTRASADVREQHQ